MAEAALGVSLIAVVLAALSLAAMRHVARDLDTLARRHFALADGGTGGAALGGRTHPEVVRRDDDRPVVVLAVDPGCLSCGDRVGEYVAAAPSDVRRVLLVLAPEAPADWRARCEAAGIEILTRAELVSDWIIVATPVLIQIDPDGREVRRRVADSVETLDTFLPTPETARGGAS